MHLGGGAAIGCLEHHVAAVSAVSGCLCWGGRLTRLGDRQGFLNGSWLSSGYEPDNIIRI